MKENNESKARFMALYWGQKVNVNGALLDINSIGYDTWLEDAFLPLFNISSLLDEQKAEVIKMLNLDHKDICTFDEFGFDYYTKAVDGGGWEVGEIYHEMPWFVADYLRSQSIALPFYCSTEKRVIEVKEMIEMGWIKIRTI